MMNEAIASACGVTVEDYERTAAPVVTEEMREERRAQLVAMDDSWLGAEWGQNRRGFPVAAVRVRAAYVFHALREPFHLLDEA